VALTDLRHYLIPDGFTITGLLWTLGTSLAAAFRGETVLFAGPYDALIGACVGAGIIAIIGWLGEAALKKEAMGMGDMTLMAFVGAALGPARALVTVFLGATIGAVAFLAIVYPIALLRRGRAGPQGELPLDAPPAEMPIVPFGVFLAPAAVIMLFWGDRLLRLLLGQG
jgi:prepilin signal peptidase PulO-like enzyme (type II secretory pathway)